MPAEHAYVPDMNQLITAEEDRHFVLPRRGKAESARAYMVRIDEAPLALRRHPRHPG